MKEAVIIHNVEQAKDCVNNRLHEGKLLFSTHSSVDVYLNEEYNLKAQCLSKFLTTKELTHLMTFTAETIQSILTILDSRIAPSIITQYGLNLKPFTPLYSYWGKHYFYSHLCFSKAIKKVKTVYNLDKICFYDHEFIEFFDSDFTLKDLFSIFFPNLETQCLGFCSDNSSKNRLLALWKKLRNSPFSKLEKIIARIEDDTKFKRFSPDKKTLLLYGDMYELDFLKKTLPDKYNIIFYRFPNIAPVGFEYNKSVNNIDFDDFYFADNRGVRFVEIFLKSIKRDFMKKIAGYIKGIYLLEEINKIYPISLGLWGNTPMSGFKALLMEYLRVKNIKVCGAQHGSVCGDSYEPWSIDADFNKCDYFISYGFTKEDLNRIYPKTRIDCEILPVGKVKLPKEDKAKKKIDILFPLTASFSMFEGGMSRIVPDKLTQRQIALLEYLNSLKEFNIYVKPFAFSTYRNCSVLPVLKRLNNLKVLDTMTLMEFLRKYDCRAIVIEFPSQPLFECLCTDAEIFVMNDDLHPFEGQALAELKRRAHYSDSTDEIISKLGLFLKGKLKQKRAASFYKHYIYKEKTKENILQTIYSLVTFGKLNDGKMLGKAFSVQGEVAVAGS